MMDLTAREIGGDDAALATALAAEHLPTDDLTLPGRRFFALTDGQTAVGYAGYEDLGGGAVLLRSLVILPAMRRRGYASAAIAWQLRHLAELGGTDAYALTVNPAVVDMAAGLGFVVLPRHEAPPPVRATRQFSGLCPASAVLLLRRIAAEDDIHRIVRDRYGRIARAASSCCAPQTACCGSAAEKSRRMGYGEAELASAPEGANLGLGCGNPQAIAALRVGETVVDLGSGAGFDSFLAARQVGPEGRVLGIDMTPEMLDAARANARKVGADNVSFLLGRIEELPLPDESADVAISNCVINLSPDKPRVFAEAFRVLKPGGRVAVSDVVRIGAMPADIARDPDGLCACISGAASPAEIEGWLAAAGFDEAAVTVKPESRELIAGWAPGSGAEEFVVSAFITARKPGG